MMEKMVAKFKQLFPEWANTDWSRIYMEIEENGVYLHSLVDGNVDGGISIPFDGEFAGTLRAALNEIQPRQIDSK
jgi:hypothetical protein